MGFHVGQIFGDYSIIAVLGAGGMGRVYKVEHCLTKRIEAMKVLSAELASDTEIKRFEREMRALARLNHPNIATLHNAIHAENQLVLLMEFIEGETLESMFSAGRLPMETGLEYIKQILSALGYAHQQGVVHRDVTPANVMITAAGEAKLTDFGLSKSYGDSLLTSCGEVLGSLPYLAPEQLKGITQPDRRSDLYSVGALLYEHLTGQKPFGAKRRLAPVITDSEGDAPPPSLIEPSLSPAWDEIIRRTLARDPAHRYHPAEEFLDAIARPDEPADVADLPLPQLRTLGIGIALFAGLVLAMVASPEFNRFHKGTPCHPAMAGNTRRTPGLCCRQDALQQADQHCDYFEISAARTSPRNASCSNPGSRVFCTCANRSGAGSCRPTNSHASRPARCRHCRRPSGFARCHAAEKKVLEQAERI